ncbi:MAG: OmpA family protein [Myxococcaceae bacterium]|nr:OmpA family protein [Myxococcaceae bacterium]
MFALLAATLLSQAVDVSVTTTPYKKGDMPSVNILILEPIAGFRLMLTRNDGKKLDVKGGGKPGQKRVIDLVQTEGKFTWKGELSLNYKDGTTGAMPLEFDTAIWGALSIDTRKEDVDLPNRKWSFKTSRPIVKAKLKVLMDTGKYAFDDDIAFGENTPGQTLSVTWPDAKGRVMIMWLNVYDAAQQYTGKEFTSWYVDIPHDEVQFDSGKADIRESESAKLDKTYRDIQDALRKYAEIPDVNIRLYIAGHTDTVAAKDYNRTLSLSRARSIGQYFKKKGLMIPVYAEGFGEEALKVQTPDDTDEQANRRADYFISIDQPTVSNASFAPKWQKLCVGLPVRAPLRSSGRRTVRLFGGHIRGRCALTGRRTRGTGPGSPCPR